LRFLGGVTVGGGGTGSGATTDVAALVVEAEPPAFEAVTTTRTVRPTSLLVRTYCPLVAPEMPAHPAPPVSQLCHAYAYEVGELSHDPCEDVRVWPCWVDPLIAGRPVLTGAEGPTATGATTPVAALVAVVEPPPFDAVTATRSVRPTSVLPSRYVAEAAPAIAVHAPPAESQRRH